ncbi:cilia- and flagella-associated protein 57 [Panulirus ornatus]|uniref:cilia- and flagella-associated protein 57 n=1 Tax=Panulirus ornatus TaxID=150431 RepID=UPI003A867C31
MVVDVEPEYVFGVRGDVHGCAVHVDPDTVAYPAGAFLVLHNTATHHQQFISIAEEARPTALAISPKRQYLALCRAGENAAVSVWEVASRKRLRFLSCGEMASEQYVAVAFSPDERMVVAQGGAPDWTLVLFLWEKGKVFSVLRLSDTPGLGPVASLTYHPEDNGVLSVVGERVLKLFRLNDKLLKTWGYHGGHNHNCHCQVWADQHTLLVGTDVATVLVLEEGEVRTEIQVTHPDLGPECDKLSPTGGVAAMGGRSPGPRHRRVTALAVFTGGFLCACGPDKVFVFQKSDDVHEHHFQRYVLRLCEASPAALVSGRGEHTITTLSLSPGESTIVAATHTSQLFLSPLPSLEPSKLPSLMFSPLHARHHEGGVVDADTCLWKPLLVTGGEDRTLRVWDYQDHDLLLTYTFKEDIFSLSLHPTGLHVAVGLADAVKLHHLLFDSLRQYSEVRIRRCEVCCFSPSGHLMAAADGNLLVLTSNNSLKKLFTLKGHAGKVTGVEWYPDSSAVMSCSSDGALLGWDVRTGQPLWEVNSLSSSRYLAATLSLDGKPTVLAGHGAGFAEITGGQMVQEMVYEGEEVVCAALAPVKTLLALGTSTGRLLLNMFPLHMSEVFSILPAHSGPIVKVVVTCDEGRLVTCGCDGVVLVWRVAELTEKSPGFVAARERLEDLPTVPEMLVSRADLQSTREHVHELERRVSYLARDKEVHLTLQQQEFASSRDALVNKYLAIIDQKDLNIQTLEEERENLKANHKEALAQLTYEHQGVLAEHQQELRNKLLYEYSKQDKLEARLTEMQQTLNRQVQEAEQRTRQELQERLDQEEAIIVQLKADLEKTSTELERERTEGAEIVRLVEASTEAELGQVRASLHAQLSDEHQNVIKLRSERAALRKNYVSVQRECEQKDGDLKVLVDDKSRLQSTIRGLERELAALRREVNHRDDIIREREGRVTTTRERIGQLEKHRFLLDHQLGQLKEQLQPLETALEQRTQQIKQLEEEMSETRLLVGARDRQVKELGQRLLTAGQQGRNLQQRHHVLATALTRVLADLANATQLIHQPKKLKDAIKTLNDKYIHSGRHKEFWTRTDLDKMATYPADALVQGDGAGVMPEDSEAVQELLRQREMLERSVATLRAQGQKQARAHKDKVTTLVKENSGLLESVRGLEERAWRLERELRQAESMAGLRDPRSGKRRASRDQLVQTVTQQAETIARLQQELRDALTGQPGGGEEGGAATGGKGDYSPKQQQQQGMEEAGPVPVSRHQYIILTPRDHIPVTVSPTCHYQPKDSNLIATSPTFEQQPQDLNFNSVSPTFEQQPQDLNFNSVSPTFEQQPQDLNFKTTSSTFKQQPQDLDNFSTISPTFEYQTPTLNSLSPVSPTFEYQPPVLNLNPATHTSEHQPQTLNNLNAVSPVHDHQPQTLNNLNIVSPRPLTPTSTNKQSHHRLSRSSTPTSTGPHG